MLRAMWANLRYAGHARLDWAADAIRLAGVGLVVLALVQHQWSAAAVMALTLPAMMLSRMMGMRAGLDLLTCTSLLIAAGSNPLELYRGWTGWDLAIHAVTTGMLALVGLVALTDAGVLVSSGRRRTPLVATVLIGLSLSAVWEMFEWVSHRYISDAVFVTYDDTIGDMVAGGVGALLAGLLATRIRLTRADRIAPSR